jgi:hypothetical protein
MNFCFADWQRGLFYFVALLLRLQHAFTNRQHNKLAETGIVATEAGFTPKSKASAL